MASASGGGSLGARLCLAFHREYPERGYQQKHSARTSPKIRCLRQKHSSLRGSPQRIPPSTSPQPARDDPTMNQCRSYQHPREPGIFANKGETKWCMRQGNREQINSQRARKRRRTIKPLSQHRKDDIGVSSAQASHRAESPIRPIS